MSPPIRNINACVCSRLRRASRALTQLYDDAMLPSGLRVTQFSLLGTLRARGPARIGDLAARLLLDRTALSRNLEPLESRGWVRVAPGADGRTREVALTREGGAALAAATPLWEQAQRQVARRLGASNVESLVSLLRNVESLHPSPAAISQRSNGTSR
jgi:DNA-binding MarR family transcriptional regulator